MNLTLFYNLILILIKQLYKVSLFVILKSEVQRESKMA